MLGSFAAPWMLGWLAAVAVPILIHLFTRQRYRRVPWAAMAFLERAYKKVRRRVRIEHLLLLILRCLAILFFVIALADPLVETPAAAGTETGRREVVIVLDDSFSGARLSPDGTSLYRTSRDTAREVVVRLRRERGDSVTIITASRPPRVVLKSTGNLEAALNELDALEVSDKGTDYGAALDVVNALSEDFSAPPEVFVIGDLQRIGFEPPSGFSLAGEGAPASVPGTPGGAPERGSNPAEAIRVAVGALVERGSYVTFWLPPEAKTDNLAITQLTSRTEAAVVGLPIELQARIRNFGQSASSGRVALFVDGAQAPILEREVPAIPPGETRVLDFLHEFREAGSHYVQARFETDLLEIDNERSLVIEVRPRIRTLVVEGALASSDASGDEIGEAAPLMAALSAEPRADAPPRFEVVRVDETGFARAELSRHDLIVMVDVGLVNEGTAADLGRFVRRGGSLWIALGEQSDASLLERRLGPDGADILPLRLIEKAGEGELAELPHRFGQWDFEHPALAYFDDPAIQPWLGLPGVYRFWRTEMREEERWTSGLRVLARYERPGISEEAPNAPALVVASVGRGSVAMLTSSLGDRAWNDFTALPVYLPFVKELAFDLTRRRSELENLTVGQSYSRALRSTASGATLGLEGAPLDQPSVRPATQTEPTRLETRPLREAGIYRIDLNGIPRNNELDPNPLYVAVNVDTTESDLERIADTWLATNFPDERVRVVRELTEAEEAAADSREGWAWWWALLVAGLLLLAETVLSQVFGARKAARGES